MKPNISDLAIFGGAPQFREPLHVGRPNVGDRARLMARIEGILDRNWLSNNGPCVQELEQAIARQLGVAHCIAICNGTIALEIAVRALGMTGEVIVPSMTFIATAHCLQWQGIRPVFCDIDPKTHNLDPIEVEKLITPSTSGIIGVHLWGRPCAIDALTELAAERKLKLIFDAAHAFACSYGGRSIGNFGAAEVLSFHATKFFNTFEGGAIVTNDGELAAKVRLMKNFGFAGYDNVIYSGTNGKMTEVCAAMGLTGLESLQEFVDVNRSNYHQYRRTLEEIPGLKLMTYDESEQCNYQYVVVEIDEQVAGISRDAVVRVLHAEQVLARRYFYPGCHRMEPYRSEQPDVGARLPNTEALVGRVMSLPTGLAVDRSRIEEVSSLIRFVLANGPVITERLRTMA